jgi:hypothetical protein
MREANEAAHDGRIRFGVGVFWGAGSFVSRQDVACGFPAGMKKTRKHNRYSASHRFPAKTRTTGVLEVCQHAGE